MKRLESLKFHKAPIVIQSEFVTTLVSTFSLVSLAEIGDKSQLVCMALATRYRHWPVFWGAAIAFLVLNLLAVIFGSTLAALVPEAIISVTVAVMFIVFGVLALRTTEEDDNIELEEKASHGIFMTTFLMILVSEFGDKTQIAVAALSTTMDALSVWIGGSLGLIAISVLGIWAGKALVRKIPLHWLHRAGGVLFLMFGGFAGYKFISTLGANYF